MGRVVGVVLFQLVGVAVWSTTRCAKFMVSGLPGTRYGRPFHTRRVRGQIGVLVCQKNLHRFGGGYAYSNIVHEDMRTLWSTKHATL